MRPDAIAAERYGLANVGVLARGKAARWLTELSRANTLKDINRRVGHDGVKEILEEPGQGEGRRGVLNRGQLAPVVIPLGNQQDR